MVDKKDVNVENDPTVLKVTGGEKSYRDNKIFIKKLSNALIQTLIKHGVARLRCVGASALNNADKAVIVASINLESHNMTIYEKKSFTKIIFPAGNTTVEKTGIVKEIYIVSQDMEKEIKNNSVECTDILVDDTIDEDELDNDGNVNNPGCCGGNSCNNDDCGNK